MSHLNNPSSGVKPEGFLGVNTRICGYQCIPGAVTLSEEEQHHIHSGIAGFDGGIMVSDGGRILDGFELYELLDDVRGGKTSDVGAVFGFTHLDHSDEVALEMTAVEELSLPIGIAQEHILLAGEQLAETAGRIISGILHGEEWEQDEQFHHLDEGKLAVRILNPDRPLWTVW